MSIYEQMVIACAATFAPHMHSCYNLAADLPSSLVLGEPDSLFSHRVRRGTFLILAFQYYDPEGQLATAFERQLDTLQSTFDQVCVSIVPPTAQCNTRLLRLLQQRGWAARHVEPGTTIADHARAALGLAAERAGASQGVFFGFLDRILFALETGWRDSFLDDIRTCEQVPCLVFERSPSAWDTHPANYREIEQMATRTCELLCGRAIDLMPCALILSPSVARKVLAQSRSLYYEVWGEWILLAALNGAPIRVRQVDWLAWEHPHWERVAPDVLKRRWEADPQETVRRIKRHVSTMLMLTDKRFRELRFAEVQSDG